MAVFGGDGAIGFGISAIAEGGMVKTSEADVQTRFDGLVAEWTKGTVYFSLKHRAVSHPAYRDLLELGPAILPVVVEKLRGSPSRLFYLLNDLTG